MRRLWIVAVVALGGVAIVWAALVSRPAPSPLAAARVPLPTEAKKIVQEPSPTHLLVREAETELLALCEERDRLLAEKNRLESSTKAQARIELVEMQIMKHIRDGHRHLNDANPALALQSFERAEAAILLVPTEIKRFGEFLSGVRAAKEKARVAVAGSSLPRNVADEHYLLAEGYFQRSDFERAKAECQKAIQADPNHLAARALGKQVDFLMGR